MGRAAVNRCATQKRDITGVLLNLEHMQGRCILRITMRFYQDFNILIECHEKSKTGRETPRRDIELIKQRLREAEQIARGREP